MRYGDKDGFNDIYDENGEIILHPDEKSLVVEENVVPTFKSTWRYYGGDYLLEPSKGTIYLTTERMVFINIPERMFAIGGEESRAVGTSMQQNFDIGDASPGAATREYFEIPNIEVMASERKEGAVSAGEMVNVYVLSSGNQFHLSMVLNSESDLLRRLMNKQVDNLDELVNNLKDYFQKTEWMFTDAEKKVYGGRDLNSISSDPSFESDEDQIPAVPKTPGKAREEDFSYDPTIPRLRISDGLGQGSVRYFQTLYRKGLIKEDIFRMLMGQYGIDASEAITYNTEPQSPPEAVPEAVQEDDPASSPEPEVPDEPAAANDEELLNMLDDTLSDFVDEAEEVEPMTEPEEPPK